MTAKVFGKFAPGYDEIAFLNNNNEFGQGRTVSIRESARRLSQNYLFLFSQSI